MSHEMTTIGNSGLIAFNGPNPDEAKKFYADVIGWNIADTPMGEGHYSTIMLKGGPIGGFTPMPSDDAHWLVYITVADVDAATDRAKKAKAKILQAATDFPGVGRIAIIQDPQGAKIALITYESMMG